MLWNNSQDSQLSDMNCSFSKSAIELFHYQVKNCNPYKTFVTGCEINPDSVRSVEDIPFLPVEVFKNHIVYSSSQSPELIFRSSTTSSAIPSLHYVSRSSIYVNSFLRAFREAYGDPENYCFLCLLPSYLEREGSSLIFMADYLIKHSHYNELSGFWLNDFSSLAERLNTLKKMDVSVILLGVTYALLDFAESFPMDLSGFTVMETGGMKGRRREMIRNEVHEKLIQAFNVPEIHSEYGMTEMLSQAYSKGNGIFKPSSTMKIIVRNPSDPFEFFRSGRTGAINIIDLSNIDSCAFIATQDLGKTFEDGSFEISGRFDFSDVRGCNLMAG